MKHDTTTCWELCSIIERETKGLGTDDNCPVPEMQIEEQVVLRFLLEGIEETKRTLRRMHQQRQAMEGRLPIESDPSYNNHPASWR